MQINQYIFSVLPSCGNTEKIVLVNLHIYFINLILLPKHWYFKININFNNLYCSF